MKRYIYITLVFIGLFILSESQGHAQAGGFALNQMKTALSKYELKKGGTLEEIRRLNRFIEEVVVEHEVKQARILRATTLANLVVIAYVTGNDSLVQSLADMMNLSKVIFIPFIIQELDDYAIGVEYIAGRQASAALEALQFGFDRQSKEIQRTSGVLRDVMILGALYHELRENKASTEVLKEFADDPCGDQRLSCPKLYAAFDKGGRQAVQALREAGETIKRIKKAAEKGDPVSAYLVDFTNRISKKLTGIVLRPCPEFDRDSILISESGKAYKTIPDAIITVSNKELQIGFIPGVRLTKTGRIQIITSGKPIFPQLAKVGLPTSYRPYMRHIDGVTTALKKIFSDPSPLSVAVGPAPEVPGHIVGRVLLSLREVGKEKIFIMGLSPDGSTLAVPMQIISSEQADEVNPSHINLRIRLGGYTLKVGLGNKEDIPRIKGEEGFQFDIDALATKVNQRKYRSAEVSFMGDIASENLVTAMFQVAPEKDPIRLVIPQ